MQPVTLTVLGQPAPQGSKRAFVIRGGPRKGQAAVIESSHDRVKSWRQAVIDAAGALEHGLPVGAPLHVLMQFYLPRPKGHYGTGRNERLLKPSAPTYPGKAPDLSKLIRATEDALTDAGVWEDDALVVMISAGKAYACPGDLGGLDKPGAIIEIEPLPERNGS